MMEDSLAKKRCKCDREEENLEWEKESKHCGFIHDDAEKSSEVDK